MWKFLRMGCYRRYSVMTGFIDCLVTVYCNGEYHLIDGDEYMDRVIPCDLDSCEGSSVGWRIDDNEQEAKLEQVLKRRLTEPYARQRFPHSWAESGIFPPQP